MTLDGLAVWDNLDDRWLPTRGEAISLAAEKSLTDWGASLDYWRAVAKGQFALSLGKRSLLEGQLEAGDSGGDLPVYEFHRIGGPALMPGFDRDELWGPHALAGAIAPS
jgi:outer membrane protein assembly factor BamA